MPVGRGSSDVDDALLDTVRGDVAVTGQPLLAVSGQNLVAAHRRHRSHGAVRLHRWPDEACKSHGGRLPDCESRHTDPPLFEARPHQRKNLRVPPQEGWEKPGGGSGDGKRTPTPIGSPDLRRRCLIDAVTGVTAAATCDGRERGTGMWSAER